MVQQNNGYILHFGNIGGMPYQYAESLRMIGINSKNVLPVSQDIFYLNRRLPYHEEIYKKKDNYLFRFFKKNRFFFFDVLKNAKLIHYHSSNILRYLWDLKILSIFNVPMIISFGGTDARIESIARLNNPYLVMPKYSPGEKEIRKRLGKISKYIKYVATDPEMSDYVSHYFEKVFILRQPINLMECFCKFPNVKNNIPIVLHIPTYRETKGTKYIEAAVEKLKNGSLIFDFKLLENKLTQKEVKFEISKADIIVDEILCGAHGLTAVEAMASGKPTITFIRDDLIDKYPKDLPIVNANPDTIYDKLKMLIKDAELRHEIGIKSRKYVEKYHSLEVIGPKLLEIYREIGLKL